MISTGVWRWWAGTASRVLPAHSHRPLHTSGRGLGSQALSLAWPVCASGCPRGALYAPCPLIPSQARSWSSRGAGSDPSMPTRAPAPAFRFVVRHAAVALMMVEGFSLKCSLVMSIHTTTAQHSSCIAQPVLAVQQASLDGIVHPRCGKRASGYPKWRWGGNAMGKASHQLAKAAPVLPALHGLAMLATVPGLAVVMLAGP